MIELLSTLTKRAHRKHQQNQQPTNLHETNKKGAEIVMKTQASDYQLYQLYISTSYIGPPNFQIFPSNLRYSLWKNSGFFPPEQNMKKIRPIWRMPLLHSLVPSWVSPRSPPLRKVLRVSRMVPRQAVSAGVGVTVDGEEKSWNKIHHSRDVSQFFLGVNSKILCFQTPKMLDCIPHGGLAPLVTGLCFLLAIPFAPVVSAVPPLASGPILCLLGALMCSSVRGIDWDDYQEPKKTMFWGCTFQFNT